MKKSKLFLILALIMLLVGGPVIESAMAQPQESLVVTINCRIEWGRKSKDCRGFGICAIIMDIDISEAIEARYNPDRNLLQLRIPAELARKYADQFESGTLIMEEDFIFTDELSKELGATHQLRIREGEYPIENKAKSVIINIPM